MSIEAGNSNLYDMVNVEKTTNELLSGKKILFLGSSVTFGACSMEQGIPEYFQNRYDCIITKEAVSGTTLVDTGADSYVSRLKNNVDIQEKYDLVVCQLSTNDATQNKPIGNFGDSADTITGAIEFIISYCKNNWNCPVAFYTGSKYESSAYEEMVSRLYEIKDKYGILILDLWKDASFNSISDDERQLYMHDPIHPTKAGYKEWWCPELEKQLISGLN